MVKEKKGNKLYTLLILFIPIIALFILFFSPLFFVDLKHILYLSLIILFFYLLEFIIFVIVDKFQRKYANIQLALRFVGASLILIFLIYSILLIYSSVNFFLYFN